jgi:hypothetical protein
MSFAVRFFQDDADVDLLYRHSCHYISYLLSKPELFQSFGCNIFLALISKSKLSRDTVDGPNVMGVIIQTKSSEFPGDEIINEVAYIVDVVATIIHMHWFIQTFRQLLEPLKNIQFEEFISILRLAVKSECLMLWLRRIFYRYNNMHMFPSSYHIADGRNLLSFINK